MADDPVVVSLTELVRVGDVSGMNELLTAHPLLAIERFGNVEMSCTALHVAADWPGHYPSVAETIAALAAAGAPIDGRFAGPHRETALHWAASSVEPVVGKDADAVTGADSGVQKADDARSVTASVLAKVSVRPRSLHRSNVESGVRWAACRRRSGKVVKAIAQYCSIRPPVTRGSVADARIL